MKYMKIESYANVHTYMQLTETTLGDLYALRAVQINDVTGETTLMNGTVYFVEKPNGETFEPSWVFKIKDKDDRTGEETIEINRFEASTEEEFLRVLGVPI